MATEYGWRSAPTSQYGPSCPVQREGKEQAGNIPGPRTDLSRKPGMHYTTNRAMPYTICHAAFCARDDARVHGQTATAGYGQTATAGCGQTAACGQTTARRGTHLILNILSFPESLLT